MGGRLGVRVIVLASLVAPGCDGLSERPGADFSVQVLDKSPIERTGHIYAPVRFAVSGCSVFDLALEDLTRVRHPMPFTARADGSFETTVPVSWMRPSIEDAFGFSTWCQFETAHAVPPVQGTLVVTCHDMERSATAEFSMAIATATRALPASGVARAIFPSDDPLLPWSLSADRSGGAVRLQPGRFLPGWTPWLDWRAAEVNPLVRPRLARRGDRVFVTLGCEPYAACPQANERLAEIALSDAEIAPPRGIAHVSAAVIDMAYASDGALVVLSQRGDLTRLSKNTSMVVSRVEPAPDHGAGVVEDTVTVIAELPRHAATGRLARNATGDLAFFTLAYPEGLGPIVAVLHRTDGHTVEDVKTTRAVGYVKVNGTVPVGRADLSPDGSSMVVADEAGTYWVSTSPSTPWWEPFWTNLRFRSWDHGGTAWLPGAVALWDGDRVEVLDDSRPYGRRWEYWVSPLPGATVIPYLLSATAVGDKLVLTTSTGIRILGPDGTLVGGYDPFPCGSTTTAVAERTGPTTVAVGAGSLLYVFDVGGTSRGGSEDPSTKP